VSVHHEETDPQHAAWLVYINGIQIPCPRVVVNYGVWKIPEATLSFPPHRLLQRLGAEDRLEVVIFYLDNHHDKNNPQFRLMFEGEICGWSYQSTPIGRSITFNAVADFSIFQTLHFFFMNTVESVVQYSALNGAGAQAVAQAGVFYPFSLFKKGLFTNSTKADITRPYDLLENTVRGMISGPPNKPDSNDHRPIPCVNFYMRWARKRNFVNRMVALPLFEDDLSDGGAGAFQILKAVQAEQALNAMATSLAQSVGDQGTVYDLLQRVCGMMYSEIAMIPTAMCARVRFSDGTILGPASTPRSVPEASEPLRLVNYFMKPQMLFGIPPSCNVIFPSMISSYSYSEQYWTQPTRVYVNDTFFVGNAIRNDALVAAATTVGYPEAVHEVLKERERRKSEGGTGQVRLSGKNVLVYPEEFFKGPVVSRMPVPAWFTYLANQAASTPPGDLTDGPQKVRTLQDLFKLYSQYEYHRSRYEQRGGSVDMIFNPYIIPGFPCYVFDHRASALDTAGYVLNVMQTMDASNGGGSMATSINYSFGRTINELLDNMKNDMARLGIVLGSAPVDPVDGVRRVSQNFEKAEQMYSVLLHGQRVAPDNPLSAAEPGVVGQINPDKKASADIREIVAFVANRDDENYEEDMILNPIEIFDRNPKDMPDIGFIAIPQEGKVRKAPNTNFGSTNALSDQHETPSRDVEPTEGFQRLFSDGPKALQYISRPICTLLEYLQFMSGEVPLSLNPNVRGERHDFSYLELVGKAGSGEVKSSAVFYEEIFTRTGVRPKTDNDPGTPVPTAAQTGAHVAPTTLDTGQTSVEAVPNADLLDVLPADFPQTRLDYRGILRDYRRLIIERQSPVR